MDEQSQPCPAQGAFLKDVRDLDPAAFRRLVGRRIRALTGRSKGPVEDDETRRELEREIGEHFEKIDKGADYLPASYLERGALRSRAVCRIVTQSCYGTGFLAGTGLVMTNNHVLESVEIAAGSVAEFEYEAGRTTVRVALEPQRFFVTSRELDFTVVACAEEPVAKIEPVRLSTEPALVTRMERVNIIQHPMGRQKEVALHNNEVVRIKDLVVHYRTDTEPGSSGSPVFNNNWDLVALHHAGWQEGSDGAINEGIRIHTIIEDLLRRFGRSGEKGAEAEMLLESLKPKPRPVTPFPGVREFGPLNPASAAEGTDR